MTEVEQQPPPQNGIDLSANEDDDTSRSRPADIEQDMREMERRKRVEAIMSSRLFREELERIVDAARDGSGSSSGILQQLSDIVGVPVTRVGSVFKSSNCLLPINDIRGVESMGYTKGEKILRCKLAATFRLLDLYGWTQGLGAQITARLKVDQEYFLVNPYGLLYHEITASSLNKVDMQGQIVEQGTTNFGVNKNHFMLHSAVHAARPDIRCAIYIGCSSVVAISSLKTGLLPITRDACVLGEITTHPYTGTLELEERDKLVRNLGPNSKVILLTNHGALCCGETIEEAFFAACHIVQASETQLKLLPVGLDNLVLIPEESRKHVYDQSRRPPEDLAKKFSTEAATDSQQPPDNETVIKSIGATPKWRVGGAEFEALMRTLDNAGYRTGYIYRHPLVKSDPPKPKNDVELPPAVSSLGYLLEEEELFRQGIWKKGDLRKGGDRSRWLNSPNVYQKVEVLETGTPDPKKITKWVAEGSPTHSTPVRIEDPLQFVPAGTNPKEFKRVQQQIKDNRRADKISAGPQSHILEGVTWDEANRLKDATISTAGDHVVLMGAASKGIIQRGYQHNATVYKTPYAKNPFDNVTDDELNEYKRTIERKKKSIHGEYTDTDFSESEPLSSLQTSGAQHTKQNTTTTTAAVSQSEPEDVSEHQVLRIETQQAPVPSQAEVVLSDATLSFIHGERSHTATSRKPPTGRAKHCKFYATTEAKSRQQEDASVEDEHLKQGNVDTTKNSDKPGNHDIHFIWGNSCDIYNNELIEELKGNTHFQRQKDKKLNAQQSQNVSQTSSQYQDVRESMEADEEQRRSSIKSYYISPQNGAQRLSVSSLSVYETPHTSTCEQHEQCQSSSWCCKCRSATVELTLPKDLYAYDLPTSSAGYYDVVDSDTVVNVAECDNPYKKSIFCYTPRICDRILVSLQQPHENAALIWNIPFLGGSGIAADGDTGTATTTAATSPRCTSRRQHRQNDRQRGCAQHSLSPYRTVSHFGFNSPKRVTQPEHKHLPSRAEKVNIDHSGHRYVSVQKAVSYEEIFSSPRYLNLCENCFEKIVRLKPEILQLQMRLRNIADVPRPPQSAPPSLAAASQIKVSEMGDINDGDSVCSANTAATMLVEVPLAPLIEETEESSENRSRGENVIAQQHMHSTMPTTTPAIVATEYSISTSSFVEKIMGMNYSEESANLNFLRAPSHVTSNITLELVGDEPPTPTLQPTMPPPTQPTDDSERNKQAQLSVLEIVDFNNWREPTGNMSIIEEEQLESQTRLLMSRDERQRRKVEFQELWEDHIAYFNGREQNMGSDNESMASEFINSKQQPLASEDANKEVYHGRCVIVNIETPERPINNAVIEAEKKETNNSDDEPHGMEEEKKETIDSDDCAEPHGMKEEKKETIDSDDCAEPHGMKEEKKETNDCDDCGELLGVEEDKKETNDCDDCGELLGVEEDKKETNDCDDCTEPHGMEEEKKETIDSDYCAEPHGLEEEEKERNDCDDCGELHGVEEDKKKTNDSKDCGELHGVEEEKKETNDCDDCGELHECSSGDTYNVYPDDEESLDGRMQLSSEAQSCEPAESEAAETADSAPSNGDASDEDLVRQFEDVLHSCKCNVSDENLNYNFEQILTENSLTDEMCSSRNASNKAQAPDNTTDSEAFNSLELKILNKIEENQLKQEAEIFDKIDTSIRNKLTPSRLASLLHQQQTTPQVLELYSNSSRFTSSTPTRNDESFNISMNLSTISAQSGSAKEEQENGVNGLRLSGQALSARESSFSESKRKLALTSSTSSLSARSIDTRFCRRRRSPHTEPSTQRRKRNFILENIHNASIPRNVKRLQQQQQHGSAQAIFCQNSFNAAQKVALYNAAKETTLHQANIAPTAVTSSSSTNVSNDAPATMYSFQSKVVRGSPRIWLSMSQKRSSLQKSRYGGNSARNTKEPKSPKSSRGVSNKADVPEIDESALSSLSPSLSTLVRTISAGTITYNESLETAPSSYAQPPNVEREIAAIGYHLKDLRPRLDAYVQRMNDYSAQVSSCARYVEECTAVHKCIVEDQQQFRQQLALNQYAERIQCDAQTYSISETED